MLLASIFGCMGCGLLLLSSFFYYSDFYNAIFDKILEIMGQLKNHLALSHISSTWLLLDFWLATPRISEID